MHTFKFNLRCHIICFIEIHVHWNAHVIFPGCCVDNPLGFQFWGHWRNQEGIISWHWRLIHAVNSARSVQWAVPGAKFQEYNDGGGLDCKQELNRYCLNFVYIFFWAAELSPSGLEPTRRMISWRRKFMLWHAQDCLGAGSVVPRFLERSWWNIINSKFRISFGFPSVKQETANSHLTANAAPCLRPSDRAWRAVLMQPAGEWFQKCWGCNCRGRCAPHASASRGRFRRCRGLGLQIVSRIVFCVKSFPESNLPLDDDDWH